MNKLIMLIIFVSAVFAGDKIFVVQREASSLAIIENDTKVGEITNMHNMNHGVVKFKEKDGYVISRDGYVIKFDPESNKILNSYKTSKSAIGFTLADDFVAVANYDDKSVDILTRDLKPIQKIKTGSKNVGIKIYKNFVIFAQMDNDRLTVLKNISKDGVKFEIHKEFNDVGVMPFDAMIQDNKYIVGFFTSKHFGTIDLDAMTYKKVKIFLDEKRQMVLKVPHFGFWSIGGDKVFVPAVGDKKVMVYDMNFKFIKNIDTLGMPVFTSLSPDKKYLAVTYSGADFPKIQIIDTKTLKIVRRYLFDGKVLHLRWSKSSPKLYVSVNDTNKVMVLNTDNWGLDKVINDIKKPSGVFIYER